jgi:hypothetical protein
MKTRYNMPSRRQLLATAALSWPHRADFGPGFVLGTSGLAQQGRAHCGALCAGWGQ